MIFRQNTRLYGHAERTVRIALAGTAAASLKRVAGLGFEMHRQSREASEKEW